MDKTHGIFHSKFAAIKKGKKKLAKTLDWQKYPSEILVFPSKLRENLIIPSGKLDFRFASSSWPFSFWPWYLCADRTFTQWKDLKGRKEGRRRGRTLEFCMNKTHTEGRSFYTRRWFSEGQKGKSMWRQRTLLDKGLHFHTTWHTYFQVKRHLLFSF